MNPRDLLRPRRRARLLAPLALLLAAACSSVPAPRLWVLTPAQPPAAGDRPVGAHLPSVIVEQARLPEYLDRPQMVTRTAANQLKSVETDQWAERLSTNIARTLARDLAAMVPADAGMEDSARAGLAVDYRVILALDAFELDASGAALLSGRWSIETGDGSKELAAANLALRETPTGPGMGAVADALSRDLASASRDIAQALRRLRASHS